MNKGFTLKGFTLIEMIVSVTVFSVAIIMIMVSYLNLSDIQRKASALRTVNDNVNFAMELMTLEIIRGKNFNSCSACGTLSFLDKNSNTITYSFNGVNKSIERTFNIDPPVRLTSLDVEINSLVFDVNGEAIGDSTQPQVQIFINASAGENLKIKTDLNIQTLVSQRERDS